MASHATSTLPSTTKVLVLCDFNFCDPKPHTIAELLKFGTDEVHYQRITSLSSLRSFRDTYTLADHVRYMIVACLSPIVASCPPGSEHSSLVGEYYYLLNIPIYQNSYSCYWCFLERVSLEALSVVLDMLKANRKLRAFIVPPLFRLQPVNFKDDISICQVSSL